MPGGAKKATILLFAGGVVVSECINRNWVFMAFSRGKGTARAGGMNGFALSDIREKICRECGREKRRAEPAGPLNWPIYAWWMDGWVGGGNRINWITIGNGDGCWPLLLLLMPRFDAAPFNDSLKKEMA